MIIANILAYCILIIGGINWGLIGIFNWNLVGAIMGGNLAVGAMIIYILVFISALWLIVSPFMTGGMLKLCERDRR